MRDSSSAVDWANSNGDARGIAPGETLVLADLKGPGVIRRIWNTINSQEYPCVPDRRYVVPDIQGAGPYYGVRVYEGVEIQDRNSVYRWHLADLIPFKESLRLEIEHWGWWWIKDDEGKEIITAGERADDWSVCGVLVSNWQPQAL